jgi:hypothetical protein
MSEFNEMIDPPKAEFRTQDQGRIQRLRIGWAWMSLARLNPAQPVQSREAICDE